MDKRIALTALSALGQETRLDVFRLLVRAGQQGLCAGEIAEALAQRQNTLSSNLAILAQAGMVRAQREGRSIRYFADMDGMRRLLGFLVKDCCGGQPDLCRSLFDGLTMTTCTPC
jgi:DNA-binding transcriptional ArsR family regulator